jgi:hypothetical protein
MPAITSQPGSLVNSPRSPQSITEQPSSPITREFFKIRPTEQDEYLQYSKYNGRKMKTEGGKTRKHKKSKRKHRKSRKSRKSRRYKK